VTGFETLLRWQHPDRGLIFPGEFLPLAEETGLIVPITRWVVQNACRQLKSWQDEYPHFPMWLSVNLSPSYITATDFAAEVFERISETRVDASKLVLEITESQLLENAECILKGFRRLNETGIKLWIDDFGSGYSSFAYLVNFPIHSLKMDRSLTAKIAEDNSGKLVTNAIVALGKSLGVDVIAEGVETPEQLGYLRSVGCPFGQGHFFGKSADAETAAAKFPAAIPDVVDVRL
jgi:EAL domain-containing protein (putative c-di-GMP-specific phosphodiesterase class I)